MSGRLLNSAEELRAAMTAARTLAVIGLKASGPAWSVPAYMRRQGYSTVAVNPNYTQVGDLETVPTVLELGEPIDMVVIFRRAEFIDDHATEILGMDPLPAVVWMQLGIRNDPAAQRLLEAGIDVVQDRCLAIEHPRLM